MKPGELRALVAACGSHDDLACWALAKALMASPEVVEAAEAVQAAAVGERCLHEFDGTTNCLLCGASWQVVAEQHQLEVLRLTATLALAQERAEIWFTVAHDQNHDHQQVVANLTGQRDQALESVRAQWPQARASARTAAIEECAATAVRWFVGLGHGEHDDETEELRKAILSKRQEPSDGQR